MSLVVPRLLALSEHHEEAAAALRVIFAASPAAVASRDVFRSMDALLNQLPSLMFTNAASVEAELSVISQLRSVICTRRSNCEELGNVGGAVACNSFIVLGGVKSLIACFNSNLCANKVPIYSALQPPPSIAHSLDIRSQMLLGYQNASAIASALQLRAVPQPHLLSPSVLPRCLVL